MKFQNLRARAYKCATRTAFYRRKFWRGFKSNGGLQFRQREPGELALDHGAQRRVVRLRAGRRVLQFVAEILRGGRQMDQDEADTVDGEIETHFAVTAHRGARDGVERVLAELAELRIGESFWAYRAEPAVELAQLRLIAVRRHEVDALQRQFLLHLRDYGHHQHGKAGKLVAFGGILGPGDRIDAITRRRRAARLLRLGAFPDLVVELLRRRRARLQAVRLKDDLGLDDGSRREAQSRCKDEC